MKMNYLTPPLNPADWGALNYYAQLINTSTTLSLWGIKYKIMHE